MKIRNRKAGMDYRRFGKTDRWLSVITLGGMRYADGWGNPRDKPSEAMIDQCAAVTRTALDRGINHIETAYGYGKSEHCYGIVLNEVLKVPRGHYHVMTKSDATTADEMRRTVEDQLKGLRTDRIDLYGWHGINNRDKLVTATAPGGPVEELHRMRDEGIIGAVGFSTHGPIDVIIDAIATGLFSFVNLHYYYFFQRNRGAVDYAQAKDIGVFIISPNDKGGKLYEPSRKLRKLCAPLTPIQFNARWCLQHPQVHTLSFGLSAPQQFEEMDGILPASVPLSAQDLEIQNRMDGALLQDPISAYTGFELSGDPSGINIPEVLRMRRMWKCYDQTSFGEMRYNMFQGTGDWIPGHFATPEAVAKIDLSGSLTHIDVKRLLNETHRRFFQEKEK